MEQALLARPAVHSAMAPDRSKPTDWYVLALFVALGANQVCVRQARRQRDTCFASSYTVLPLSGHPLVHILVGIYPRCV